jgi:hypothetical protein
MQASTICSREDLRGELVSAPRPRLTTQILENQQHGNE